MDTSQHEAASFRSHLLNNENLHEDAIAGGLALLVVPATKASKRSLQQSRVPQARCRRRSNEEGLRHLRELDAVPVNGGSRPLVQRPLDRLQSRPIIRTKHTKSHATARAVLA